MAMFMGMVCNSHCRAPFLAELEWDLRLLVMGVDRTLVWPVLGHVGSPLAVVPATPPVSSGDAAPTPFVWDPTVPPRLAGCANFDPAWHSAPFDLTTSSAVILSAEAGASEPLEAALGPDPSSWALLAARRLRVHLSSYLARYGDKPCCVTDCQRYLFWYVFSQ